MTIRNPSELARLEEEAADELFLLYGDIHTQHLFKPAKEQLLRRIRELEHKLGLTSHPYNQEGWYERSNNALRNLRR